MQGNIALLNEYVERGLLRKQEDEDLVQYNYSEECNNQALWDEITLFNRGNIYEKKTGELVARAMPKFMNLFFLPKEKQQQYLSTNQIMVTEKMDGCLGILYKYKGKIRCNSRGGFDNYVTDKIKELLPKYVLLNHLLMWQTLNVEVISPTTKIICDYGTEENLYLITSYGTKLWNENDRLTNELISQCSYMPIVKKVDMTWEQLLEFQKTSNFEKEGYVVQIGEERVKVKSEDYLRIAGLRAKLHKHTIWRHWKSDILDKTDLLKSYLENVPDELYKTAQIYMQDIEKSIKEHEKAAINLYESTKNIEQRDLLTYFQVNPSIYQGCVYNLRNGKPIDRILIKLAEPENDENDIFLTNLKEN